jgi:hypothetical protein
MLETLLKILAWDFPSPEILLEEDGDICLEWSPSEGYISISISPSGKINWAAECYGRPHGTELNDVKAILEKIYG